MADICPFCGLDMFERVDVGIGCIPVAVNCCEYGIDLYRGADFGALAEAWMAQARGTMERYASALRKIVYGSETGSAALRAIADEALNGPPIVIEGEGEDFDLF